MNLESSVFAPWGQNNDIILTREMMEIVQKAAAADSPRGRAPPRRPRGEAPASRKTDSSNLLPRGAFISMQSRSHHLQRQLPASEQREQQRERDRLLQLKKSLHNFPVLHPQQQQAAEDESASVSELSETGGGARRKALFVLPPIAGGSTAGGGEDESKVKSTDAQTQEAASSTHGHPPDTLASGDREQLHLASTARMRFPLHNHTLSFEAAAGLARTQGSFSNLHKLSQRRGAAPSQLESSPSHENILRGGGGEPRRAAGKPGIIAKGSTTTLYGKMLRNSKDQALAHAAKPSHRLKQKEHPPPHRDLKLEPTDSAENLLLVGQAECGGRLSSFFSQAQKQRRKPRRQEGGGRGEPPVGVGVGGVANKDLIKTLYRFSKVLQNREMSLSGLQRQPNVVDLTPRDSVPSVIPKLPERPPYSESPPARKPHHPPFDFKARRGGEPNKLAKNPSSLGKSLRGVGLVPEGEARGGGAAGAEGGGGEGGARGLKSIGIGTVPERAARGGGGGRESQQRGFQDYLKDKRIMLDKRLLETIENPEGELRASSRSFYAAHQLQHKKSGPALGLIKISSHDASPILLEQPTPAQEAAVAVNTDFDEKRPGFHSVSPPLQTLRRQLEQYASNARLMLRRKHGGGLRGAAAGAGAGAGASFNQTVRGFGFGFGLHDGSADQVHEQWHELIAQYEGQHRLKNRTQILAKKVLEKSYAEHVKKYLSEGGGGGAGGGGFYGQYEGMEVRGTNSKPPARK